MDYSMPGFPVLHHLPEFAQSHVHRVGDAIQPSHPLSPSSPSALQGSSVLSGKSHGRRSLVGYTVHGMGKSWTRLSDFTFSLLLLLLIYKIGIIIVLTLLCCSEDKMRWYFEMLALVYPIVISSIPAPRYVHVIISRIWDDVKFHDVKVRT